MPSSRVGNCQTSVQSQQFRIVVREGWVHFEGDGWKRRNRQANTWALQLSMVSMEKHQDHICWHWEISVAACACSRTGNRIIPPKKQTWSSFWDVCAPLRWLLASALWSIAAMIQRFSLSVRNLVGWLSVSRLYNSKFESKNQMVGGWISRCLISLGLLKAIDCGYLLIYIYIYMHHYDYHNMCTTHILLMCRT